MKRRELERAHLSIMFVVTFIYVWFTNTKSRKKNEKKEKRQEKGMCFVSLPNPPLRISVFYPFLFSFFDPSLSVRVADAQI